MVLRVMPITSLPPAPGGEGLARCMDLCLKDGNVDPTTVDYINAHGTSTQLNDKLETEAIKTVLETTQRALKSLQSRA